MPTIHVIIRNSRGASHANQLAISKSHYIDVEEAEAEAYLEGV